MSESTSVITFPLCAHAPSHFLPSFVLVPPCLSFPSSPSSSLIPSHQGKDLRELQDIAHVPLIQANLLIFHVTARCLRPQRVPALAPGTWWVLPNLAFLNHSSFVSCEEVFWEMMMMVVVVMVMMIMFVKLLWKFKNTGNRDLQLRAWAFLSQEKGTNDHHEKTLKDLTNTKSSFAF